MRRLGVLGSTGSIGVTTLGLVERFPDQFDVVSLAAGRNVERLAEQVIRFRPKIVAVADEATAESLRSRLGRDAPPVRTGREGLIAAATADEVELLVSGLVGALGLVPTLEAIRAGKDVGLANKEVLVVAGELVTSEARRRGVTLHPIDSEHNAIFQCLQGHRGEDVRRIVLTASGGPFRGRDARELRHVTPAEALRHPTWDMGDKITIDSATLMNKGLEVIEARWLFDLPPERIDVLIHPQSVIHSMVEYVDGSVLSQMGIADMTVPISYILGHPERLPLPDLPRLDLAAQKELTFFEPDTRKFPCLGLAYRALESSGTMPAVLNAANEVAVEEFLARRIAFTAIPETIERVMEEHTVGPAKDLEIVLEADRRAREAARKFVSAAA